MQLNVEVKILVPAVVLVASPVVSLTCAFGIVMSKSKLFASLPLALLPFVPKVQECDATMPNRIDRADSTK